MLKNQITILIIGCFLITIFNFISCHKESGPEKQPGGGKVEPPTALAEWNKCRNKEVTAGFPVKWKVKITSVNIIGGLSGKGYLEADKSFPVQLKWDPASEFYKTRKPDIQGETILITGTFWGVSEKQDVIIHVKNMELIKK